MTILLCPENLTIPGCDGVDAVAAHLLPHGGARDAEAGRGFGDLAAAAFEGPLDLPPLRGVANGGER